MINLYDEKDYENAVNLKKKLLIIYLAVLGGCFLLCAGIFTLFLLMPYALTDELIARKNFYLVSDCAISILFAIFSFVYLCIPYRRAKYYLKMLDGMKTGDKSRNEGTFLQNYDALISHNFVDVSAMAVLEWSERTQEYVKRHVFVDKEKKMPDLKSGDMIVYITHGNVLMSYGLKADEEVFNDFKEKEN